MAYRTVRIRLHAADTAGNKAQEKRRVDLPSLLIDMFARSGTGVKIAVGKKGGYLPLSGRLPIYAWLIQCVGRRSVY